MNLVFLGPPGAGKGTQAKEVAKEQGLAHISTGDILREAVKNQTETGLKAKQYMDAGDLVPDAVVVAIIGERIQQADCQDGYVLDGFPRTYEQAEALADTLGQHGMTLDRVVYFDVDAAVLVERLTGRRTCRDCAANYHVKFMPPKADGVCDKCSGELYQREDDNEQTVRNRIDTYEKLTADLIDYYRQRDLLSQIDAAKDVAAVQADLKAILD